MISKCYYNLKVSTVIVTWARIVFNAPILGKLNSYSYSELRTAMGLDHNFLAKMLLGLKK